MNRCHACSAACGVLAVLLAGGGALRPCYGEVGAPLPPDDAKTLVNTIRSAIQSVDLAPVGRGAATVSADPTHYEDWGGRPRIVDFAFKNDKSRMDFFEAGEGTKGSRVWAQVTADKEGLSINQYYAKITRTFPPVHTNPGFDFHPKTLLNLSGELVVNMLKEIVETQRDSSVTVDANDTIRVVSRWSSDDPKDRFDHFYRLAFDPHKSFLPSDIASAFDRRDKPEDSSCIRMSLDWAKYGSGWYVRSGRYTAWTRKRIDTPQRVEFTVTSFDPNAEVSDDEFTLQGLGIKDGMTVVDGLAGVSYRYGTPVHEVSELEEAVEQAAFTEKAETQSAALPDKEPNQSDEAEALAQAPSRAPARIAILLGFLLLVTAVAAYAGYRRALARASHGGKA